MVLGSSVDDEPRAILEKMESDIAVMGIANAYSWMNADQIHAFGDALEAGQPFATIARSWVCGPDGGGRSGAGLSGKWAWHQLLYGKSAEAVLCGLRDAVKANRYEIWDIRPVRGITVTERQTISADAWLAPPGDIPAGPQRDAAFQFGTPREFAQTDTAALIQRVTVAPALGPVDGRGDAMTVLGAAREARDHVARRLRLALGLASGGPVEIAVTYYANPMPALFSDLAGISAQPVGAYYGPNHPVDMAQVVDLLGQLDAIDAPAALELSIDRLLRSRLSKSIEDRIIDLGMAAEIALMHEPAGGGDGKGEITNKMAARAAWLVEGDTEQRLATWAQVSELYGARSIVVHSGLAKPKIHDRLGTFDTLAAAIIKALLARGAFPNWRRLVLGGD